MVIIFAMNCSFSLGSMEGYIVSPPASDIKNVGRVEKRFLTYQTQRLCKEKKRVDRGVGA
jgi:hypothetical protein